MILLTRTLGISNLVPTLRVGIPVRTLRVSSPRLTRRRGASKTAFPRGAWERGVAILILGLVLLPSGVIGQEPREANRDRRPKFAGRIYIENYLNADTPLSELLAVDPNDGTVQKVAQYSRGNSVRVSPDGSRLLLWRIAREDVDPGLWIYKSNGEKEFRISERRGEACWSPDGRSVLVSALAQGRGREMWRIDVDGSHEERLNVPEGDEVVDCSPDANWLIIRRRKLRDQEYHVIHPEGTGDRLLDASKLGIESTTRSFGRAPRFSPDGRKVFVNYAVSEYYEPVPIGQPARIKTLVTGLLEFDVDGGAPRRLLERKQELGQHYYRGGASWSPDGRAFALCGIQVGPEGGMFVELFDPDGKALVRHPMPGPTTTRTVIDWR